MRQHYRSAGSLVGAICCASMLLAARSAIDASPLNGRTAGRTVARCGSNFRKDSAGWVFVHLEGSPGEIGFAYGWLLAPEIDDNIRAVRTILKPTSGKDWSFYRAASRAILWPNVDAEYRAELAGIAAGLCARGRNHDTTDILALNGWIELAWYYVPWLQEQARHKVTIHPKDMCSALVATGTYTRDGKIVMAHNCWVDYALGERWRVIADIRPRLGHRILMDTAPGLIHSGDDFAENDAGILITETTIGGFHGFNPAGVPEFVRMRKAAQYSTSIDDFVRIMTAHSNGGYANDWLVGDTKTNEIARLELGLKHHPVTRTRDGVLVGANFPCDAKLTAEETNFDPRDIETSGTARRLRWERLMDLNRGKLDAQAAKRLLGDHFDQADLIAGPSSHTLCGHVDLDGRGVAGAWPPYYPAGSVQSKVTTSALAEHMQLWARFGHPCGEPFRAARFFRAHPEYRWQSTVLHDFTTGPWHLFASR